MAAVNSDTMALPTEKLNGMDEWLLDFLHEHEWATPNLMRQFYNDDNDDVSRQWVSRRLGRLAEHDHVKKVHENADEYRIVDDPRDGDT